MNNCKKTILAYWNKLRLLVGITQEVRIITTKQKNLLEARYYKSCSELPLDLFIMLFNGCYNVLIISGKPTKQQIEQASLEILKEYNELNANNEMLCLIRMQRDLAFTNDIIINTQHALYLHIMQPCKQNIVVLENYGFELTYPVDNPDTSIAQIRTILSELSILIESHKLMEKEFQEFCASSKDDKVDAKYFMRMLTRLSKHRGKIIASSDITVRQFCMMLEEYLKELVNNKKALDYAS
ncbi:hypothetical protein QWZ08_25000 [Ferruginibacter paludis]|uniref:hypothetical protein n=1 Tax=Ferruginibacter paludis TaxID=1310417 RepID=UPI0025B32AB5|nr:hypothetical protein [Ferruginibacter paludis]MDN3658926.1 hypothetical protein [Ferruginibacter paludis]